LPCLTPLAHDGTMGVQGLWTAVKEIKNNKSLHEALPRDGGGSETIVVDSSALEYAAREFATSRTPEEDREDRVGTIRRHWRHGHAVESAQALKRCLKALLKRNYNLFVVMDGAPAHPQTHRERRKSAVEFSGVMMEASGDDALARFLREVEKETKEQEPYPVSSMYSDAVLAVYEELAREETSFELHFAAKDADSDIAAFVASGA
jgi:hypothetical protein